MSEHLPECPKSGCDACYEQGQRDALAAAVQRVEALPEWPFCPVEVELAVIAAIKAVQP
jgi:hypothetical protein